MYKFRLREALVPYLSTEYEHCRRTGDPLIAPVFLREPSYDPESDCFFCGRRLLACPVFDEGAEAVTVLLPQTSRLWRLRGEGETFPGGTQVTVPCAPEDLPVWFTEADPDEAAGDPAEAK
jgi:alpha-glucosidase